MTRYLLDTSILILAKNQHYMFEFCPAFWDWLIMQNKAGKVTRIEKVGEELQKGNDALSRWADQRGPEFFRSSKDDDAVRKVLPQIDDWAKQNYEHVGYVKFWKSTDCWLVAYALAHGFSIVTHEMPVESRHKIKIPNACAAFGIDCISPYKMLYCERARFVLDDVARRSVDWQIEHPPRRGIFPAVTARSDYGTVRVRVGGSGAAVDRRVVIRNMYAK